MRIVAVIALAVVAMFVLYNVVPRGSGDENNAGRLTVEAAEAATEQAGAVMDLFRDMNPTGKADASPASANPAANGGASANGAVPAKVVGDNTLTSEAGEGAEISPEGEPDIWPSKAYNSARVALSNLFGSGDEVQDAYNLMRKYSEVVDENDKFVKAARDLREAWEPLYVQAHEDYKVLNTRIELAKSTSKGYFEQQAALTATINDAEFRNDLRNKDLREQEIFDTWATNADDISALAYDVMRDMQDIDTYIAKTNLSAHFAALQSATGRLPASLEQLELQLEDFRTATDALNSTLTGQSASAGQSAVTAN